MASRASSRPDGPRRRRLQHCDAAPHVCVWCAVNVSLPAPLLHAHRVPAGQRCVLWPMMHITGKFLISLKQYDRIGLRPCSSSCAAVTHPACAVHRRHDLSPANSEGTVLHAGTRPLDRPDPLLFRLLHFRLVVDMQDASKGAAFPLSSTRHSEVPAAANAAC